MIWSLASLCGWLLLVGGVFFIFDASTAVPLMKVGVVVLLAEALVLCLAVGVLTDRNASFAARLEDVLTLRFARR
ncbi:hypothetical protein [Labrys wisconsinensis]|uniref:Uncharacterized protein n=1 Tax=Labrys wisconsinensis TaxID=425677 RepID=A0ABU0J989_9HYPH|nr:hypothetical protein [Labrys wisconsinensis]MDQ0470841.1 hypothetical protein [Labrys wisconsinensis]